MTSWPHAPARRPFQPGAVMVTGGTLLKSHLLTSRDHLLIVQESLFEVLQRHGLDLEAWAILRNHYHFVANGGEGIDLSRVIKELHSQSSRKLNQLDNTMGRRVWYQFWDTQITIQTSYMARLAYVHHNPVKHGAVEKAEDYEFCSMSWLFNRGERPWVESVLSFKIDQVNVYDDF